MEIIRKNNMEFSNLKIGDTFIWGNECLAVKIYDIESNNNTLSLDTYQTLILSENEDVIKVKAKLIIK
jgi:hypothetical protein